MHYLCILKSDMPSLSVYSMKKTDQNFQIIADYYQQHYEELKTFCHKRLGGHDTSEDLVQTAFLRLLSSDKMITPVTMPCLVYTILRNLIYDFWRRRHSYEEYEHYIGKGIRGGHENVESVYSAVELNELLEKGIDRLPDNQRAVYVLNIYDGMKISEISHTLHLNYKSVEHKLGQARKEIRNYIRRMLA